MKKQLFTSCLTAALITGLIAASLSACSAPSTTPATSIAESTNTTTSETAAESTEAASPETKAEKTVNLYLVRHGKTIMNTLELMQGWTDSPLTEAGVEVAENAAYGLRDTKFDYVYSSDRVRSTETAEIILSKNNFSNNLPIKTVAGLRETNFGSFEGVTNAATGAAIAEHLGYQDFNECLEKSGMDLNTLLLNYVPELDTTGNAETEEQVVDRLVASFEDIVKEVSAQGGGDVLIVGHGSSLLAAMSALSGDDTLPGLANASVSKLVWEDGKYSVEFVNNTEYAEEGAATRESENAPVTIYLTRHGKTWFNTTVQGQGWIDSPLTDAGIKVAVDLGKGLADVPFAAAYTSGLGRTIETAQLVLDENKTSSDLELLDRPGIRETNYGIYEGAFLSDCLPGMLEHYGVESFDQVSTEEFLQYFYETDETGQAENMYEVMARVYPAFVDICKESSANGGGNILVVSHGNAIMAILKSLGINDFPDIKNASVTKIIYDNGKFTVESINDMSYAEAGAAK